MNLALTITLPRTCYGDGVNQSSHFDTADWMDCKSIIRKTCDYESGKYPRQTKVNLITLKSLTCQEHNWRSIKEKRGLLWQNKEIHWLVSGAYPGGRTAGGPSELLILAPSELKMLPSPLTPPLRGPIEYDALWNSSL